MSDHRTAQRLIGSSVVGLLALAVNLITSVFLLPFLIIHLGDEWYGTWVLIGSVLGYFTVLDIGLFSATERYVALHFARRDWDEVNIVLSTSLVVLVLVGLAGLLAVVLATLALPVLIDSESTRATVRAVMLVCALDLALFFPGGAFNGVIVARLRYDLAGLLQIGKVVLRTVLIVYFVREGYSILALAAITLATNALERGAKIWLATRLFPELSLSLGKFSRRHYRDFVAYGVPSFLTEVSDKLRFYVDNVVVGALLGVGAVTGYNIAVRLAHYYIQVIASGVGYLLPVFTAQLGTGDLAGLRRSLLFSTRISVAASAFIGGFLVTLGGPVIELWVGPSYRSAALPLVILIVGLFVEVAQTPSTNLLFALNRQSFLARLGIVEALANLVLSLALARLLGLTGVALGTALPLVLLRLTLQPAYVCRQVDVPLAAYARAVLRAALPAVLLHGVLWLVLAPLGADRPLSAVVAGGSAALPLGFLVFLTAFDGDERRLLLDSARRWLRVP